jgi:hypothetical protein
MKLPHAEAAIIAREKLEDYLLSRQHPVGRLKARFFKLLGYTREEWPKLEKDIRSQLLVLDARETGRNKYGVKYVLEGPLTGPAEVTAMVTSVWVVRSGEE